MLGKVRMGNEVGCTCWNLLCTYGLGDVEAHECVWGMRRV